MSKHLLDQLSIRDLHLGAGAPSPGSSSGSSGQSSSGQPSNKKTSVHVYLPKSIINKLALLKLDGMSRTEAITSALELYLSSPEMLARINKISKSFK